MQIVVLAGGLATRMRPVTETIPKALIPVESAQGNLPFVHYQLEYFAQQGVTSAIFCVGYLGEMIRDVVKDGSQYGIRVEYTDEGKDLKGTAGALRLAYDAGLLEERFFVIYGDSFLPIPFTPVWNAFAKSGRPALMTVFENHGKWEVANACYESGPNGSVVPLYDKKSKSKPENMRFVDYGLLCFERDLIAKHIPPGEKADLADVLNTLSIQKELAGFLVEERFYEIGSFSGLADFTSYLKAFKASV